MTTEDFMTHLREATARRLGEAVSAVDPKYLSMRMDGCNMTAGDIQIHLQSDTELGDRFLTEFLAVGITLTIMSLIVENPK